MRSVLLVMLLAVSAFAQEEPSAVASACGPKGAWLDVKLDESQHTLAKPEPGKARIYFVQLPHILPVSLTSRWSRMCNSKLTKRSASRRLLAVIRCSHRCIKWSILWMTLS
jgi:hypothetical protein